MNRKGFLLAEETLKIIIALISISVFIYFLASLYIANKDAKDLELAKASLIHLMEEINKSAFEVEIYNPNRWVILSWPYEDEMPLFCSNLRWDNCICICKDVNLGEQFLSTLPFTKDVTEKFANNCDKNGICMKSELNVFGGEIQSPIIIQKPPIKLNIDYTNKIIR